METSETYSSLKEFFMLRIDGVEKITDERFKSVAMALVLQAEDYKRRLENISTEVERLRKKSDETGGKEQGANNLFGYIVAVIGIAFGLVGLFLRR